MRALRGGANEPVGDPHSFRPHAPTPPLTRRHVTAGLYTAIHGPAQRQPADLLKVADDYAELAHRAAVIGPQTTEEVNRIIASHGPMGYPVAVGIATGMAPREAQVTTKSADFTEYSQRFTEHAATYQSVDAEAAERLNQASMYQELPSDKPKTSELSWKPGDPRRKPVVVGPGQLGPPVSPNDPWIEVGPRSGIFVPKDEIPGVQVYGPGALGPPVQPSDPYIELIPDSGVWVPKSDLPDARFYGPGALGPPAHQEWLPGSGIWIPGNQLKSAN